MKNWRRRRRDYQITQDGVTDVVNASSALRALRMLPLVPGARVKVHVHLIVKPVRA